MYFPMPSTDDRKPPRADPPQDGSPAGKPRMQRCRDCREYLLYGPAICSFCLSDHVEWVSDARQREVDPREPE